ncbi:hypothetical protein CHLNCDRAFT_134760 [Chlorella variabilis]|uniref:TUG ubiquitin-like domain-containing protein n=1 Tax=Chlorella variabilis TaxID=554065 RepID=E1ZGP9_CHLVA|nr:hypothetical protein CHLNCDRAFT_134760 [Chlorella variabilis]EFN54794.1 hypothetical protein CHLNCDRAFT_134760 [Chlorella variabilis]|eukprot:XP_005846896.1 hypothetical protein CHLNCDRAFT_134760 [Chlorella variabilis]
MSAITVEAHRKRFSVKAAPMQPLSAVVAEVLGQLKLPDVRPEECRLVLKGKALDLSTPVRFANIGRDKLELHTGREQVLGVQEAPQPVAAVAPAAQQPPAAAAAQPIAPSASAAAASQAPPAAAPAAAAPAAMEEPSSSSAAAAAAALHPSVEVFGQRVWVFTRAAEQQAESSAAGAGPQDVDDAFFEFTEMDLRRVMASQVSQRAKQEGGHLMTAAMREKEERRRAESHGAVPIRLLLPDGQHCLQTALPATAPLRSVLALARAAMTEEAAAAAYLFTTPPRTVLKDLSASLYAAKMVPAAKVHVGIDVSKVPAGGQLIKPEVLALVEQPPERAAVMHANKPAQQQAAAGAASRSGLAAASGAAATPARAGGTGAKGVPKWLKIGK